jgi:hypothetical protein
MDVIVLFVIVVLYVVVRATNVILVRSRATKHLVLLFVSSKKKIKQGKFRIDFEKVRQINISYLSL